MDAFTQKIGIWLRYIDDVFLTWEGTLDELDLFVKTLHNNTFNLKFTYSSNLFRLPFLDLTIIRESNNVLRTTLYRKQTAGNTILHATSSHPTPLIKSIPYGQYLRLKRNCSTVEDFEIEARKLRDRLYKRGYNKKMLKKAYKKLNNKIGTFSYLDLKQMQRGT